MDSLDALEDEGEIGQLKQRYGPKTALIKEMFPDWSDVDILFALQETDGDENLTVTRIAEGKGVCSLAPTRPQFRLQSQLHTPRLPNHAVLILSLQKHLNSSRANYTARISSSVALVPTPCFSQLMQLLL